ncbi:hypothetical protein C8R48DRAFT_676672 [Suillus tomentosus]|nr:hypothetical protein C8R48DRAFT_676672 [Suillus tomentosus]
MSVNESVVSPHENDSRSALHLEVERPISSIETPVNVGGTTQDMNAGLVTPFILVFFGDNPIQSSCGFHQRRNCRFAVEQYPDIPCIAGADPNSSDSENMRKSLAGNEEQSTKQYGDRHEIWDRNLSVGGLTGSSALRCELELQIMGQAHGSEPSHIRVEYWDSIWETSVALSLRNYSAELT